MVFGPQTARSLGINHGIKFMFTRIVFFELVRYLMAKTWVEMKRISEYVDGVEP